jgi:hypothetical protein
MMDGLSSDERDLIVASLRLPRSGGTFDEIVAWHLEARSLAARIEVLFPDPLVAEVAGTVAELSERIATVLVRHRGVNGGANRLLRRRVSTQLVCAECRPQQRWPCWVASTLGVVAS